MKKLLTSLLCVVMIVCFMPTMAWADASATDASTKGSIEKITDVAVVSDDTITVSKSILQWYAADASVGRHQDGWWVGFKIVSPAGLDDKSVLNVKYSNDGTDTLSKNFGTNKDGKTADGKYFMGCWLPVKPEYLENALAKNSKLQWTYKFDWSGDGKVDQIFTATVDPDDITLNKDGEINCQTVDGIMTKKDGKNRGSIEKITDVAVVSNDAITVSKSSLQWYAKEPGVGRYQDGWWVGFKIVAPDYVTDANVGNVNYSNDGTDNLSNNFGTNKDGKTADGRYYMGCWLPVKPEYLEGALAKGANLQWKYKFDWDGNGEVDQTFIATVDPDDITLNKDGEINCRTENGIMTIKDGALVRPYVPTAQTPTIEADENATVTLSDYGTKAAIKVADGYELADVTVNGVSKGKVDTLTGLKTGDKVVVTTKKIVSAEDEIAAVKATKLVARTAMSKAKGKKAVKVYWYAKDGSELNFDGYEVYRSLKRYEGYGTTPFFKTANEKYYNTAIKKGTRYYYKVRAYKVIDGEKIYTEYSTKAWRTVK